MWLYSEGNVVVNFEATYLLVCVSVLQEQKALLEEGFEERAELMNKEIQSLKGEMEDDDKTKQTTLSKVVDAVGLAATLFLPGLIPKAAGMAASFLSRYL